MVALVSSQQRTVLLGGIVNFTPMRLTFDVPRGTLSMLEVESVRNWVVGERYLWMAEAGVSEDVRMHGFKAEQDLTDDEWRALDRLEFPDMESNFVYVVLENTETEAVLKHAFGKAVVTVTYGEGYEIKSIAAYRPN